MILHTLPHYFCEKAFAQCWAKNRGTRLSTSNKTMHLRKWEGSCQTYYGSQMDARVWTTGNDKLVSPCDTGNNQLVSLCDV
mgnify:CR=1 FL=1